MTMHTLESITLSETEKGDVMSDKPEYKKGDILSITEASEYLEVSRQRVHFYIKDGRFPNAYQVGIQWNIPFEDILNLEVKSVGRPPDEEG